jgi:hypothetical protein
VGAVPLIVGLTDLSEACAMITAMDANTFWLLLETCRPSGEDPDAEQLTETLTDRLSAGPVADVIGFAEQLSWQLYRLDRSEYGADLSGDAFLYTRCAVVAAGREEYERVIEHPERFVPYVADMVWAEGLLYVPDEAYEHLTGNEWSRDTRYSYESYSNAAGWARP